MTYDRGIISDTCGVPHCLCPVRYYAPAPDTNDLSRVERPPRLWPAHDARASRMVAVQWVDVHTWVREDARDRPYTTTRDPA